MDKFFNQTLYFGIVLSLSTYWLATRIRKKFPYSFLNPLLISAIMSIFVLYIFDIDYETYHKGAQMITNLLTPATVCLAVPMYKQTQILIKHLDAIIISLFCGSVVGMLSVVLICVICHAPETLLFSLLPKSITTAIAIGVSELIGGNSTITVGVVIVTGIIGACLSQTIFQLFHINHPVARGLALGNSAHAIGTAKALEYGELEGAMSSLSIVIAGIFTVVVAPIIVNILF